MDGSLLLVLWIVGKTKRLKVLNRIFRGRITCVQYVGKREYNNPIYTPKNYTKTFVGGETTKYPQEYNHHIHT